jgi:signal transduction histidine kinase
VAESRPDGRSRLTLRVRIAGVATAVVAVALVAGAVLFGLVLRTALLDGATASAEAYAGDVEQRIEDSGIAAVVDDDPDDRFFQVLAGDGDLLAVSENAQSTAIVIDDPDADAHPLIRLADDDQQYVLAVEDVAVAGGEGLVIVGQSTEDVTETLGTVVTLLAVAVPLVVLLVAATTWIVVGRALRPVERMRSEVAAVTSSRLDQRLAEPGTNDEIGRLASTLNGMLDRLDEAQATQRRFISDASHELRSPLASLRQFAEVARAHPDRVDSADLSDAILEEGARLERLVDGMLTLARADEHTLSVGDRPVDLDDLVLAEVRRVRSSTDLAMDAAGVGPARVLGDPGLIAQLLRNLVDNATRHAAGALRFELSDDGSTVLFAVDDDGSGVAAADRERVFDRFVRLDEARARESGGSGLGLAIAREIVAAHGGTVVVTGSPLGGARFEVRLPAASLD